MSSQQLDLFGETAIVNPLSGKRICLNGSFRMPQKELSAKLNAVGVDKIDRASDNRKYKEEETMPPTKMTHFYVEGSNPHEEVIKRFALNEHDGFHAKVISEEKLYEYLAGQFTDEDMVPDIVEKKLHLDYSYYNWAPPVINGKTFVTRVTSPLSYDSECRSNPITRQEIYVPDFPGVDMYVVRQLIGNLGGYGNKEFFDETNIVMLSDSTLRKLKQGIKDDVILGIENRYNKSNSKIFNIQFTSESDFISWAKIWIEKFSDESSRPLLAKYYQTKKEVD